MSQFTDQLLTLSRTALANVQNEIYREEKDRSAELNVLLRSMFDFTRNKYDSIDEFLKNCVFYSKNVSDVLLVKLFYTELLTGTAAKFLFQHTNVGSRLLGPNIQFLPNPSMMHPLFCMMCNQRFTEFDASNFHTKLPKLCCPDCQLPWKQAKVIFEESVKALDAHFRLIKGEARLFAVNPLPEEVSTVIAKGYGLLQRVGAITPRYTLSPMWKSDMKWFHQDGIINDDNRHPLLNPIEVNFRYLTSFGINNGSQKRPDWIAIVNW